MSIRDRLPRRKTSSDMEPKQIVKMDIKEFRELGFLQEANRLFFHPLGLALEVHVDEDGNESLGGIWDYRDDPQGLFFSPEDLDADKKRNVSAEGYKHAGARRKALRYPAPIYMAPFVVQDLGTSPKR